MRSDHDSLLRSAGFIDVEEIDLTEPFAETTRSWLVESDRRADELAALYPPGGFDERQAKRRAQLAGIEAGLLRRSLFTARSPAARRE